MSNSTPIDALRRDEEPDPAMAGMVDHMTQEMEQQVNGGGHNEMPPSMEMPPDNRSNMEGMPSSEYFEGMPPQFMPPPGHYPGERFPRMPMHHPQSLIQKVTSNLKDPLVVAALFIVLNNEVVTGLIGKLVDITEKPFLGLLIRALVGGVVFLLMKVFM